MKLLNLGLLIAIPAFVFAQDSVASDDGTNPNATAGYVASLSDSSQSSATIFEPLTPGQKVKRRALRLIEPVTLFNAAAGAGIEQLRNVPPEWGRVRRDTHAASRLRKDS